MECTVTGEPTTNGTLPSGPFVTRRRPRRLTVALVLAFAAFAARADEFDLRSAQLRVRISPATGQILALIDAADGREYVSSVADVYFCGRKVAGGRRSDETRDVVTKVVTVDGGARVRLDCTNRDFAWLTLTKDYELKDNVLARTVTYRSSVDSADLFSIRSRAHVPAPVWRHGSFFFTIDDGYKTGGSAVLETEVIRSRIPLRHNNANIVFADRERDCVVGHYLYHVNGRIAYPGTTPVPGFLENDGWSAGVGCEFISPGKALSLTTHLTLVKGDARHFHQQYYSLPEFLAFRREKDAADWVAETVQWQSGYGLHQLLDRNYDLYTFEQMQRDMRAIYPDELAYTIVIHHAPRGDYRLADPMHYLGADKSFEHTVPLAAMREAVARVRDYSERQKVGLYTIVSSVTDVPGSWCRETKDWLVYREDGSVKPGYGGLGTPDYAVDFAAPGWAENYLRQAEENIEFFGLGYWYIDSAPWWVINWKEKRVASTADAIAFYQKLRNDVLKKHGVPLMLNCGWGSALFCDFGLFETYSFHKIEKQDWRVMAYMSFMSKLARLRPFGHPCAMVQGLPPFNLHISGYGLNGLMGQGTSNGPAIFPYSVVFQRLSTELFEAKSVPLPVHPSWWRGETEELEVGTMRKGDSVVLPVIWHGEAETEQTVWMEHGGLGFDERLRTFLIETEVTNRPKRDLAQPPSLTEEAVAVRSCREFSGTTRIEHSMQLRSQALHYLFVSQTPGVVLSSKGRPFYTLLNKNRGVHIRGTVPAAAREYTVKVSSDVPAAEILLRVPDDWRGGALCDAMPGMEAEPVSAGGARFLRLGVRKGTLRITVAERREPAAKALPLRNPQVDAWHMVCSSLKYKNLTFRTMSDGEDACLEVKLVDGRKPGRFVVDLFPDVLGQGLDFSVKANAARARFSLELLSADWNDFRLFASEMRPDWSATLPSSGWHGFSLRQSDFGKAQLSGTRMLKLSLLPSDQIASLKLKGLRFHTRKATGDRGGAPRTRRYAVIPKVKTPPSVRANTIEGLWQSVEAQGDLFDISGEPSGSKTVFRACYDDGALYVFVQSWQSIARGEPEKERDAESIWNSNCNEILLNPTPGDDDFFHFMVDSGGNRYDAAHTKAGGEDAAWNGEWQAGASVSYQVSWAAKVRIPFGTLGVKPARGDLWRLNVTRAEVGAGGLLLSSWSPSPEGWLDAANFGAIVFGAELGWEFDVAGTALLHVPFDGSLAAKKTDGAAAGTGVGAPTFVEGLVGQALAVSNTDGCSFPATGSIRAKHGTVEFFARPLDWHRDDGLVHQIFGAGDGTGAASINITRGSLVGYLLNRPPAAKRASEAATTFALPRTWRQGTWHHIVFTWNAREMATYVDGEICEPKPTGKALAEAFSGKITLGAHPWLKEPGRTAVDELRVYRRPLVREEVERRVAQFRNLVSR